MQILKNPALNEMQLIGSANVSNASKLHSSLLDACSAGAELLIDCTKLDSVDAACAQVLLAAQRSNPKVTLRFPADASSSAWLASVGLRATSIDSNSSSTAI